MSAAPRLGVQTFVTDETLAVTDLARLVEDGGFESLFLPDHTHIPVERATPYPHPPYGELPRPYYRIADPLVSLGAAAAVTDRLLLGTAVCLPAERDPIVLAKQVATLDHLAGGRVVLGVGAGWNLEETRNHGVDPTRRTAVLGERVRAMQEIWRHDEAEFHGRYVDFAPIHSWPKPVQRPHPPVLLGGNGPTVLDRVLQYADGWMPGHQRDLGALGARVAELRARAAAAGRPDPEVTVVLGRPELVEEYARIGADRVVFGLPEGDRAGLRRALADLAARVPISR
ncbi:LLM class F420-dependent oxidoreductase [Pseudonocardia sp. GCM10023141]|uniref:LLM class F420-dependent oxidoreductase n=1 Tax=Pseudonocardia sp. GCM10023141 TaxID=3252653 RepID=UPI003620F773